MRLEHCIVIGREARTNDRLRCWARRLRANARAGSAIVEFAIIAPVFFMLMFAIMEVGIIYFAQSTLQYGTDDIARMIRTGQVSAQGLTQAQIRTRVCTDIAPLIPCDGNLNVDVESFANFGSVNFSPPLDQNGNFNPLNNFQTGTSCSVVLVRVFYAWSVFTPILNPFLVNMSNNKHMLYSASAFRSEPFSTDISGC